MASRASRLLLPVIYLGFISLGLPDGMLGVAWLPLHVALDLPIGLAGTLLLVTTLLSAFSSYHSGRILARFATGPVMLACCAITGAALLIIAHAHGLPWLLVACALLGLGAGAVDAGLNGYVARHYSRRQMNWLHASWGIGATCGPLVMTRALGLPSGWRGAYITIASAQLALALVFLFTLRLWDAAPARATHAGSEKPTGPVPTVPAHSVAGWLSASMFAIYVAVEATAGLWASSILVASRGVALPTAGLCATAYYAAITVGRILVGFVADRWGNRSLVTAGLTVSLLGALLFVQASAVAPAAAALVLLGLGFAPVYPCLMHEVPRRFAPDAVQVVIGRQSSAAYLGAASLPALAGSLAQISLELIAWTIVGGVVLMLAVVRRLDRIT